jgi:hypothetical protein
MLKKLSLFVFFLASLTLSFSLFAGALYAQTPRISPSPSPTGEVTESTELVPTPSPRPDITQGTEETLGPLEKLLEDQELGPVWPLNPIKYAIRGAISAGVPANTLVLLLLLPLVATIIAASRHVIGLRGFGIFLPAALSVVFVSTGPIVGIGLFMVIIVSSFLVRVVFRKFKIKLQYLPRMALILLFVVFGVLCVLFAAPVISQPDLSNASIFPILILVLLAEDFTKVQLGKSAKTAISLSTETLILALVSFIFLTSKLMQELALLNPEILLLSVIVVDFLLGKYVGLRFAEYWRFRKLITG